MDREISRRITFGREKKKKERKNRGKIVAKLGKIEARKRRLFYTPFRAPRHRGCRRLSGRPWSLALESARARCYSLLLSLSTLSCLVLSCPIPTKYRTYLVHYARLARAELGTGFSTGSLLFFSLSLSLSPSLPLSLPLLSTKSHRYLLRDPTR